MYKELQTLPELSTLVSENGDISFYDSFEDMKKVYQVQNKIKASNVTAPNVFCKITLYWHKDFGGEAYEAYLNPQVGGVRYVGDHFNDEASSLRIAYTINNNGPQFFYTAFYEHSDYRGPSLVFRFTTAEGISNTYNVPRLNYPRASWGRTWNDAISSFRIYTESF